MCNFFFFFNDTATTEIYTLSLHDALPICPWKSILERGIGMLNRCPCLLAALSRLSYANLLYTLDLVDIRSEEHRLNSSHANISYAVFCLKKKKKSSNKHILVYYKSTASQK